MSKKLTEKQKLFCKEYLVDLNATKASIRSGYSKKTSYSIGQENLKKPEIQECIQKMLDERSKRVEIDADYVIGGIKETTEECRADNDRSGAFKGYELLGKHLQLFTEKISHGFDPLAPMHIKIEKVVRNARDSSSE